MEYVSGLSILLSRYQNLKQEKRGSPIFAFYASLLEAKTKLLEEFNTQILGIFRHELSQQAEQIHTIMQDLMNADEEIEKRKSTISKRDLRIQVGHFGKRRAAQATLLSKATQILQDLGSSRASILQSIYRKMSRFLSMTQLVENQKAFVDMLSQILLEECSVNGQSQRYLLDEDKCEPPFSVPTMVNIYHHNFGELTHLSFGVHIIDLVAWKGEPFPSFLRTCLHLIEDKCRVDDYLSNSTDQELLQSIVLEYESKGESVLSTLFPDILTGLVLKFFDGLPEPLFPFVTHQELDAIALRKDEDIRLGLITKTLKNLPSEHFFVLSKFIEHLYKFWGGEEPNGKHLIDLSTIVGKVIIRKDDLKLGTIPTGMTKTVQTETIITRDLIANFPLMFGAFIKK